MIPSALLNGIWKKEEYRMEIRVLELSEHGFSFRAANRNPITKMEQKGKFCLRFFLFSEYRYQELWLEQFKIRMTEKTESMNVYQVDTKEAGFRKLAMRLSEEYMEYIRLFLEEDQNTLEHELAGYPEDQEDSFYTCFEEQKKDLVRDIPMIADTIPQGIVLDAPWVYEEYQKRGEQEILDWYHGKVQSTTVFLTKNNWKYVYIGNMFCWCLFPEEKELYELLEHTRTLGKEPVLQIPCVEEADFEEVSALFRSLETWIRNSGKDTIEIVVNDWGMLKLLSSIPTFRPTLGIFLIKQKKDARMRYKKGITEVEKGAEFRKYGWMSEQFQTYIKERYGVERISAESTQLPMVPFDGKMTLYAPWYQMNTSTRCTLAAICEQGDRGRQVKYTSCQYYCKENGFLYPKHLNMAGQYNTIFGYDITMLEYNLKQGADRLVWNFL